MPKSQPKQQSACEHEYCPHLHFQRCKKNRVSNIAYTHWPIKEIELTCNQHPKTMAELRTANIPTLAVQRYLLNPVLPDQEDTNFSKNYYHQNCPQNYQLRNTMLKDLEEEIQTNNAYVLAVGARTQYQSFAKQRQEYLKSARRRAGIAFQQFYQNKKTQKESLQADQKRWIIQYYRKVQELIDHIFAINDNQNEDPNLKDKLFLKEQEGNNPKKLATIKVKDPQTALGILQSLRAVLLVKKLDLQQVRKDQQHNKSATASQIDTSNTQNTSQQNVSAASFISAASNATNQTNAEQHNAEKYCNFEELKKKWGKGSVEEVRKILRMMLCRDTINKAEGFHMRERKKAQQKDDFLRRQMQKMNNGKKIEKHTKNGKTAKNIKSELTKNKDQQKIVPIISSARTLSKQDQIVKQSLVKGGIFDSLGNIYQRNRNYSHLFKKRAQQSLCQLSMRQSLDGKARPETARTSFR